MDQTLEEFLEEPSASELSEEPSKEPSGLSMEII